MANAHPKQDEPIELRSGAGGAEEHTMGSRRVARGGWAVLLLVSLGIASAAYTLLGLISLAWDTTWSYPIDLRLRWVEERLVWQGGDPQVAGHPDPDLPKTHESMKQLGGSYPPWAYATGLILVPPLPWGLVRWYAAVVDMVALGVLGRWAYLQVHPFGWKWAWVAVGSALAMFPMSICLSYGQYGVIIAAGLAAVDLLLERRDVWGDLSAGVVLGVALIKPQLSGLFALAVLIEGRWLSVAACGAYLAVASGVAWGLTGSDPVAMFERTVQEASMFSFLSHNPLVPLAQSWFGFRSATAILGLAGLLVTLAVLVPTRSYRRLARWSACAVVSMFWAYRKHYDVPLLVFPLIGLLLAALERRSAIWWVAYAMFGLTVWAPIRDAQWGLLMVQIIDLMVWVTGAGLLLWWGPRMQGSSRIPSPAPSGNTGAG